MSRSSKEDEANGAEEGGNKAQAAIPQVMLPAQRSNATSPRRCRSFIRKQTAVAMPDIVTKFVDMAKQGSVPHFTSLAKIGGFDQRSGSAQATDRRRKSLGRQLLEEVERYEANQAAEQAERNASTSQIDPRIHIPGSQERS